MTEDGALLRDSLLAETDDNPFFVGKFLLHLAVWCRAAIEVIDVLRVPLGPSVQRDDPA
jgi:hypothetical protein